MQLCINFAHRLCLDSLFRPIFLTVASTPHADAAHAQRNPGAKLGAPSRSQQSNAKATRTLSPLSQPISKPSEHQRRLRSSTAMRPQSSAGAAEPT
jgi:hypothetical protein